MRANWEILSVLRDVAGGGKGDRAIHSRHAEHVGVSDGDQMIR
jgi:hypothetical protein